MTNCLNSEELCLKITLKVLCYWITCHLTLQLMSSILPNSWLEGNVTKASNRFSSGACPEKPNKYKRTSQKKWKLSEQDVNFKQWGWLTMHFFFSAMPSERKRRYQHFVLQTLCSYAAPWRQTHTLPSLEATAGSRRQCEWSLTEKRDWETQVSGGKMRKECQMILKSEWDT